MYQGEWRKGRQDGRGAWFGPDGDVYDGLWSAGRATGGALHSRKAGTAVAGVSGDNGRVLVWQYGGTVGGPKQRESVCDVLARLADIDLQEDIEGLIRAAGRGHFDAVWAHVRAGCNVNKKAPAEVFATESWYFKEARAPAGNSNTAGEHQLLEVCPVEAVCLAIEELCRHYSGQWPWWIAEFLADTKNLDYCFDKKHHSEQYASKDPALTNQQTDIATLPRSMPDSSPSASKFLALRRVLSTLENAGADVDSAVVTAVVHGWTAAVALLADTLSAGKIAESIVFKLYHDFSSRTEVLS